jgi:hypothetical protein
MQNHEAQQPRKKHDCCLKFLLSNHFAGVLIGSGGRLIKELMEITQAEVHVSNSSETYPGTNLRCIYITGSEAAVNLAQSLVWEMIGQQTFAQNENNRSLAWHPTVAKNNPGEYDQIEVEGNITIPATAGGMIVGKGGLTIRGIAEESGVEVSIDSKDDAELTNERMMTLRGTVAGCMNCTFLILSKLLTMGDDFYYNLNGTTYSRRMIQGGSSSGNHYASSSSSTARARETIYRPSTSAAQRMSSRMVQLTAPGPLFRQHSNSNSNTSTFHHSDSMQSRIVTKEPMSGALANLSSSSFDLGDPSLAALPLSTISAYTTIELGVPDRAVGAIVGVQGATLAEIESLSGATVTISKRGDFVEGTLDNRRVTIVGTPNCAQTAHTLIVHKLRQNL